MVTLLVIDASQSDRERYAAYLAGATDPGYRVIETGTGAEGLVTAVDVQPDCVLLDYKLPDADGLQILERLDRAGLLEDRAVLMLTADGDERVCAAAMRLGALDYACKTDVDEQALLGMVARALARARTRRDARARTHAIEHHAHELARAKQELEGKLERLERANRDLIHAQDRVRYELSHDPLTQLPNRTLLEQQVADAIRHADRLRRAIGMVTVRIQGFGRIQEALGRAASDDLVRHAADQLQAIVRESDVVGRIANDEFGILLRSLSAPGDAGVVARKVLDTLSCPHEVAGGCIPTSWEVGIALYPRDGRDAETLLLRSHTAMCQSSEDPEPRICFYDSDMNQLAQSELVLESRLRRGLEQGELALVYQPLVSLEDGRLTGVEALLRWNHPTRGLLGPDQFLPLAERSDLIVEIGDWVLAEGLRQAQLWERAGLPCFPVSFNVSRRELRASDFPDRLIERAFDAQVPLELVRCELTESALGGGLPWACEQALHLKELGVGIALDDFGMAHASLTTLESLPIDTVKIDRRFVTTVGASERNAAITSAILTLARSLSLDSVAVGVEERASMALLGSQGCAHAQGWAVSRPLSGEELLQWASRPC